MIKNYKILSLIIIAIVFVGIFYWYEIRPARIRQDCHKWVVDLPGEVEKFRSKGAITQYEALYEQCLHERGLK
jgi:type II secretory pathway component PulF